MDTMLGLELSEKYASHSTAMEIGVSLSARERTIVRGNVACAPNDARTS